MKTTLKRGVSSNGRRRHRRAPSLRSRRSRRYAPRRRSRFRVLGRVFVWMLVTVLVAIGGLAGGSGSGASRALPASAQTTEAKAAQKSSTEVPPADQPAVAIVIGYD